MKIIDIIKDVFYDLDHNYNDARDFYKSQGDYSLRGSRGAAGASFFKTFLPNFAGFFVGLAFTKFMGFEGIAYLILGIIGAMGIGVLNSVLFQGISLKYAVIRHVIIVLGLSLIFGLLMLL